MKRKKKHLQGFNRLSSNLNNNLLKKVQEKNKSRGFYLHMYIRGFVKFGIKVLWRLQVLEYLRILHLKFQKAPTKIEVFLTPPTHLLT